MIYLSQNFAHDEHFKFVCWKFIVSCVKVKLICVLIDNVTIITLLIKSIIKTSLTL